MVEKEKIIDAIKTVYDLEIPVNVYDLGLIRELKINEGKVYIKMTWTSPMCPYGPLITKMVEDAVRKVEGVGDVEVDVELDPPWSPKELTEDGKRQMEMLFGKETVERWLRDASRIP
ncbi:MAG: hypothetical protein PWQ11_286 [Candidatus Diapherotrites archaeon]|nr:hypothetical protein [Candidatus Diapherotrites archaeon]